jgi:transposase-like protein
MSKKKESEDIFDYNAFEKEAIQKLKSGKDFIGPGGVFTDMIGRILQAALDGEMDDHLSENKPNRRNGHTSKQIKTSMGSVELSPPRDREGSFEPELIPKWKRSIDPQIEKQILTLYGMGNSYSDISNYIQEMYGVNYSTSLISKVTGNVWEEVDAWRSRPLQSCYALIYLDAIHFKVRDNGRVTTKAIYTAFGVDMEGSRDVLGLYIDQAEGARFWGRVLENLKDRGIEDVLFFSIDGLKGFPEVIEQVFPNSIVQRCIVHMIRTSLRYVSWKDYKTVCKDLRTVYRAADEPAARRALEAFDETWRSKYPEIAKKWNKSWDHLTAFMDYPEDIRRMIYTTNAVEAVHKVMRKTTKTKGAMTSEDALIKLLYLTLKQNEKSWKRRANGWSSIIRTLANEFPQRTIGYF